ncbi:hypothetical protein FJT64_011522 [Amphibalanus amphitrite]|uniref:SGNH hydrolase-type esterase domain-containing protein n=1 Tax=Amphibalanus amphitrite TaxID=1232801 RepID=A0A6A4V6I3_AMPAM|nr:hypothetical protein FJT64_011522 [Amphibalanus amphitrite]
MADSLEVEDVEAAAWYRRQAEEAGSISHWPDDADPECPDAEDAGVEVGVFSSSSGDLNPGGAGRTGDAAAAAEEVEYVMSSSSSGDLNLGGAGRVPLRMRPAPLGRLHLLLGCSIARDAGLGTRDEDDMMLNLAVGGNTWQRAALRLHSDLQAWRKAATAFGLDPGTIVLWFSGNEAYDRRTGANLLVDAPRGPLEAVIRGVLYAVRAVAPTVVLGPLPRFWVDRMLPWEHTAAYRLDRKVKESAAEGEFVSLGKSFTTKMSKRHVVLDKARAWFRRDGVHLTREGYCKVAAVDTFPTWLRMDAWDA